MVTVKPDKQFYIGQKAFIEKDGSILVLHDPLLGLDFPGGKIQEGETDFTEALRREVREETSLEVTVGKPFTTWHYQFPQEGGHRNAGKDIYIVGFTCAYVGGEVTLSDEHDEYYWVNKTTYQSLKEKGGYYEALRQYFESRNS
jgi:8-oxo-dGTP diphosphatase